MGDIVVGDQHPDPSIILLRAFHDHRRRGHDIDRSYRYAKDTHPVEFEIVMERALWHGHQLGVPGDTCHWRYEIMLKGHHRHSQNGVSIGRTGCASCVVVKYRNHNFADAPGWIRLGGSGGRIKEANRQGQRLLRDQEMSVYNLALHRSLFSALPIRLYAHLTLPNQPGLQYFYVGLVMVTARNIVWTPENFQCYEYRVARIPENAVPVGPLEEGVGGPEEQVPHLEVPNEVLALEWHAVDEPNADVEPELDDLEDQQQEKVTEQPSMLQGGELSAYQLEGLEWMLSLFNNNLNGILADEMGWDKTVQTISLIAYLMEIKNVAGPHLIVVPKAVVSYWMTGFNTWVPSIIAVHYDGRMEERKVLRDACSGKAKFNVLVSDYDMIMRDRAYLKKVHWHYMIVDGGHRLITYESLARTVESGFKIRRKILLTGNPVPNSLQELWPLLNFVLPNIFNSAENFEEWSNAPFADRCDVYEEKLVISRLHQVLRPFLLSRKKEEVCQKSQVILKCDMSAWQKVYYHQVTDVGRVGLGTGTGKLSLHNLSMQLRKCCNHPYLFGGEYDIWGKEEIVRASGKFDLLDRLLPKLYKAGHRVVVFSQMTRLMDILGVYLELHGFKFLRYDGSTKPEERETLVKQFNAPNSSYFMFLQSTHAGSLGLDMHTADTVIIFDSDWNLPMYKQADDIVHCIGKKREVRVFLLASVGSVEEAIMEHAKPRMGIGAKVIQAGLINTAFSAQDRRKMLEDIMRKGSSSLGRDVPSEREINYLAARSVEEFWMFEKMDKERQKENSRCRLMEANEVPEWAYAQPNPTDTRSKRFDCKSANVSGKRCLKPVVYANTVSESQWTNAGKYGEPVPKHMGKRKMKENLPPPSHQAEVVELKSEPVHGLIDSSWLTWKIHKSKRSRCIYMPPHPVLGSANIA